MISVTLYFQLVGCSSLYVGPLAKILILYTIKISRKSYSCGFEILHNPNI